MPDTSIALPVTNLEELMAHVAERWKFDDAHHPAWRTIAVDNRQTFAAGHIAHHLGKAHGKLSEAVEAAEHRGGIPNPALAREAALKTILGGLRLASLLGISADEVLTGVPAAMNSAPA